MAFEEVRTEDEQVSRQLDVIHAEFQQILMSPRLLLLEREFQAASRVIEFPQGRVRGRPIKGLDRDKAAE